MTMTPLTKAERMAESNTAGVERVALRDLRRRSLTRMDQILLDRRDYRRSLIERLYSSEDPQRRLAISEKLKAIESHIKKLRQA